MQNSSTIGVNDVLLGRGGATNNHEGNRRYRTIVADHQSEYLTARKKEKVVISRKIVATVHSNGGRFLKRDAGGIWVEVPDKRATEKTSQALREGLDVRNNTVRPKKQVRRLADPDNQTAPKVVVAGWVVPSMAPPAAVTPVMMGLGQPISREHYKMPELVMEKYQQPLFSRSLPTKTSAMQQQTKKSGDKVCEV